MSVPLGSSSAEGLVSGLAAYGRLPKSQEQLTDRWLEAIAQGVGPEFDTRWGGFGGAPKFPPSGTLAVLLAHWKTTGCHVFALLFVFPH